MHNDDRNVLSKFQIDPVYRLGAMAKTSSSPVKIQQQQLEGADLNMEMNSCSLDPARECLQKQNNHTSDSKELITQRIQSCSSRI